MEEYKREEVEKEIYSFYSKKREIYHFYATPDGEECLQKTYYYTKYSGLFGAVLSAYEMVLLSKPQTIPAVVSRFTHFTLPFAGMGFVFGASICLLAHLRKKSDVTNHTIAGALSGVVWGVRYRRVHHGHVAAVLLGFTAGYFKYFAMNDYPMFPLRSYQMRDNSGCYDFTIKMYDDPGRPNEA